MTKNIQLIKAGTGYNKEYRASYVKYRVIIDGTPIEDLYTKDQLKNLSYWSPRGNTMSMTCWGTSQSFEAQLKLAEFLNVKGRKGNWPNYTRRVQKLIKVI